MARGSQVGRAGKKFRLTGGTGSTDITTVPAVLRRVVVGTAVASATITIRDGATVVTVLTLPATVTNPFDVAFEAVFGTKLNAQLSNAGIDCTFLYD